MMSGVAEYGYTLATGRLFADFSGFHEWCERLMERPILTHEFADESFWSQMRKRFEKQAVERVAS